jgi:hypothetical protein
MNDPMHNANMDRTSTIDEADEAMAMPRTAGRMVLITSLIVLLLAFVGALLMEPPSPTTAPDCASIKEADLRLQCYDSSSVDRSVSPPARGAIAPKAD